ncbi:MAG: hypothetical protein Kow0025_10020 [Thermodesulfovibrionales bacterium]
MEKKEALQRIKKIIGQDLRSLAQQLEIDVFINGKKNKGWAGHVIERYLCLPLNSAQSPNLGSWELKTISLKRLRNGEVTVKETMAITMIDPYNVARTTFAESHLKNKLQKTILVARMWEGQSEPRSELYGVYEFKLTDREIYARVEADYNLVRDTIIEKGFEYLTGRMGVYIQPRTKGPGHGSTSRAFYARTGFLKKIIGLS